MGLIRNVTEEIKTNNQKYTEECKKIYEGIRFCKVQTMFLHTAVVPIFFSIFTVFFLCVDIWYTIDLIKGKPFGMAHIVAFLISGITLSITVGILIYYILQYRKKGAPRYFVKDDGGEFEIYCRDTGSEELTVSSIVHSKRHKILYVEGDICSTDSDSDDATERNGFYEFLVSPDKVFDKDVITSPIYRYKKKKIVGNITYYYFSAFDHPMFGTRKPRSLKLENGVVTAVCQQKIHEMQGTVKTNCFTLKYEYSHVNDDSFKIHIPEFVQEQAEKLKFLLPKESANIVYDKT